MLPRGPVLVLGCPRSGTTALAYPLFQRNCLFTNELNVFGAYAMEPEKREEWICEYVWALYRQELAAEKLDELAEMVKGKEFREQIEATYEFLSKISSIVDLRKYTLRDRSPAERTEVIQPLKQGEDNKLWGDKHPTLVLDDNLPDIVKTWPTDARVIYVQRDGRDVIASLLRLEWIKPEEIGKYFDRWAKCYYSIKKLSRVLFVRQETLLTNPASVVKSMNRFLRCDAVTVEDYQMYIYKHSRYDEHMVTGLGEKRKHQGYWKDYFNPGVIPSEAKVVLQELGYA